MKGLITILFAFLTLSFFGQERDFQTWYSFGLDMKLSEKLKADFGNEVRLRENSSIIERNQADLGIRYRLKTHWSFRVAYRLVFEDPFLESYSIANRFLADITYKYEHKRLEISSRLRLATDPEEPQYASELFSQVIHREKITLSYNLPKTTLAPYIAGELFFPISAANPYLSKYRVMAGFDYKLNKTNRIGISLLNQWKCSGKVPSSQTVVLLEYLIKL
ncbi:MAG: DUF2490 domain-containing protein [Bacteroidetes bacterium]|nr:DUF2490 domain-containing protein [Bacteroidota bacterium]MBU1717981.1 DUF2490 domain-containing protein [Bacteroidota bacterium]